MKRILSNQSFLGHAAVYGVGTMLTHAAGFLLLPLYTRTLTAADFGTLEVLHRVGEIVAICLLFGGVRQAGLVFYRQSEDETERRRVAGTMLVLLTVGLVVGGGLALTAAEPVSHRLETGSAGLLGLAVVALVLESMTVVLLALSQARLDSLFFVGVTLGQFLARVAITVALVVGLGWGLWGVLAASACTSGLMVLGLAGCELARGGLAVDRRHVSAMLRFALPLLPCGLGMFLMNNGDRFFLLRWGGEQEVGTYALGYKLALGVLLVSRQPLAMVWNARMYDAARTADAPLVFGRVARRILGAYLLIGLGLCVLQDEAVALLGGRGYAAAGRVIAPVVLAYFFSAAADLMDAGFYVRRRTGFKTWITRSSTAVMLLLYAALIPPLGAVGAAYATLGGFAFHAGLTWLLSRRVFPVSYEWGRLGGMVGLAAGLWLASRLLPATAWAVPVKLALWAAWPAGLWWGGLISAEEKDWIKAALRRKSRLRLSDATAKPQAA